MKELLRTFDHKSSRSFLSLWALLLLFAGVLSAGTSCINGLGEGNTSDDPINLGIIAFFFNPDVNFGNSSDETEVQISTEEFPDGSAVQFDVRNSSLPQALRGCFFDADTVLSNGGQAFVDYTGGINIASSTDLLSDAPPVAGVNIAATVTPPGGNPESDFETLLLNPVGMVPPPDTDLTSGEMGGSAIGLTLEFQTIGLPPGTTIVNFTVSNPGIGSVSPTSVAVLGSEDVGSAVTQYTSVNNTGGTQVVTARAILPNPSSINPNCPNVPEADRTVEEFIIITQSAPDAGPSPSPPPAEICNNGVDDDGDALTDCQDTPACDGVTCDGLGGVCMAGSCS